MILRCPVPLLNNSRHSGWLVSKRGIKPYRALHCRGVVVFESLKEIPVEYIGSKIVLNGRMLSLNTTLEHATWVDDWALYIDPGRTLDSEQIPEAAVEGPLQNYLIGNVRAMPVSHDMRIHSKSETCCICLSEFGEEPVVSLFACGHVIHRACACEMLSATITSCPVCRCSMD